MLTGAVIELYHHKVDRILDFVGRHLGHVIPKVRVLAYRRSPTWRASHRVRSPTMSGPPDGEALRMNERDDTNVEEQVPIRVATRDDNRRAERRRTPAAPRHGVREFVDQGPGERSEGDARRGRRRVADLDDNHVVSNLLTPLSGIAADKQHWAFRRLIAEEKYAPARDMLREVWATFPNPDSHFVREFQTRGFDARIWELVLAAVGRVRAVQGVATT